MKKYITCRRKFLIPSLQKNNGPSLRGLSKHFKNRCYHPYASAITGLDMKSSVHVQDKTILPQAQPFIY